MTKPWIFAAGLSAGMWLMIFCYTFCYTFYYAEPFAQPPATATSLPYGAHPCAPGEGNSNSGEGLCFPTSTNTESAPQGLVIGCPPNGTTDCPIYDAESGQVNGGEAMNFPIGNNFPAPQVSMPTATFRFFAQQAPFAPLPVPEVKDCPTHCEQMTAEQCIQNYEECMGSTPQANQKCYPSWYNAGQGGDGKGDMTAANIAPPFCTPVPQAKGPLFKDDNFIDATGTTDQQLQSARQFAQGTPCDSIVSGQEVIHDVQWTQAGSWECLAPTSTEWSCPDNVTVFGSEDGMAKPLAGRLNAYCTPIQ
jgi:hypothetical protein